MAVGIAALAWLMLQLVQNAAVPVDPERCTEIEVPTPVTNERALLQAGVGKRRVTLADTADDSLAKQNATNQTLQSSNATSADMAVVLAAVGVSSNFTQETEESGLQRIATASVLSLLQHTVRRIHEELPASLVYIFPTLNTDIGAIFGLSLATFVIWCTLVAATASLYRSRKAFPQAVSSRPEQDFNDWTSGSFDIFSDWKVCCWSCWCPCIRWADNMDMLGIVSFWVGLLIFCALVLLGTVPGGLLFWLVASLLWMSFRQQFRMKFDMEQNNLRTFVGDCMLYCCCWPCAIAQEARHIEEACRAAHKAVRKADAV